MKEVFDKIAEVVPKMGGWCTLRKANTMAALAFAIRPSICCEIGVFYGRSAVPLAMALKHIGQGVLLGVDPYDAEESAKNENPANAGWWKQLPHEEVLSAFSRTVDELGLQNCITLHRMTSDAFQPPPSIDILHIDGSHSEQAIRDTRRYASQVRLGGFVFMDDCSWDSFGPKEAMQVMEKELGFVKLYQVTQTSTDPTQPGDDWALYCRTHA